MPTGPIIKEGFPLIGVMLFITIIAVYFGYYSIAIITFILAIVSWTDLDSVLKRGQLYGMIKFGSCTEIYMDKNVEICIEKGQHITGGDTIIGRLRHE